MNYTINPEKTKWRGGLYILGYAMAALAARRITVRQALLLAHVDRWCNGYRKRHPEPDNDSEMVSSVNFHMGYLRRVLRCESGTVRRTIEGLRSKRPRLLKVRRVNLLNWEMKSVEQEGEAASYALTIPPPVRKLFECGRLTPLETLLLAYVSGFTRKGRQFFASNEHLAGLFGVNARRARRVVRGLVARGFLDERFTTRDGLRQEWKAKEIDEYKGRGRRTVRLLVPTLPELGPPDGQQEDDEDFDEDDFDDEEDDWDWSMKKPQTKPKVGPPPEWDDDEDEEWDEEGVFAE